MARRTTTRTGSGRVGRFGLSAPCRGWSRSSSVLKSGATLIVVLVAEAVITGCGQSGSLTHAQLVQKGDAICSAANAQLGPLPQAKTRAQVSAVIDKVYASGQDQINKLTKLKAGPSDRPAFAAFIKTFQAAVTDVHDEGVAFASGNESSFRSANLRYQADSSRLSPAANRVGFTVCGAPARS